MLRYGWWYDNFTVASMSSQINYSLPGEPYNDYYEAIWRFYTEDKGEAINFVLNATAPLLVRMGIY